MIKIENIKVDGFDTAIRGMRNPMNSWDRSDSYYVVDCGDCGLIEEKGFCTKADRPGRCDLFRCYQIGNNDFELMKKLIKSGTDHSKFMRMINVSMDITAPLYFIKEFDTYKVGTTRNSCSTMHKITSKEFTLDDFSHEHLTPGAKNFLSEIIDSLNEARSIYINFDEYINSGVLEKSLTSKKDVWWQIIQLLPSSYNQRFTWSANYEVLRNMYHARKNHKLDEWQEFCNMIETVLPYSELITM